MLNTGQNLTYDLEKSLHKYLKKLLEVGIPVITVGTLELCRFVKKFYPEFHIVMSITYGTNSKKKLRKVESAKADSVYLDGVFVNRNFKLLRSLVRLSKIECKLYANMSCISHCPVVNKHYKVFAGPQSDLTRLKNDAFFAGCSLIKLKKPIEWIQMPWIRPEDMHHYEAWFDVVKLATRMHNRPRRVLGSYIRGKTTGNLLDLTEPGFGSLLPGGILESHRFPEDWFDKTTTCNRKCHNCDYCRDVFQDALVTP